MEVANHALKHDCPFMMNLSAPFLSQFFKEPMMEAMPYVDILFGNETVSLMEKVEQGFVNIACKYHICLNLMHP
jgi:adenosine kinase